MKVVSLLGHSILRDVQWSPDGKTLVNASQIGVWIYTALQERPHLLGNVYEAVAKVAFNPDGSILATASDAGDIALWNIVSETKIRTLKANSAVYENKIYSLAFSSNGELLALSDTWGTQIWNLKTGELIKSIDSTSLAAFSNDLLAIAERRAVVIYMLDAVSLLPKGVLRTQPTVTLTFNRDGSLLAVGDTTGVIRLWNTATQTIVQNISTHHGLADVAFSPDKQRIVSVGDQSIQMWRVETGQTIADLEQPKPTSTSANHSELLSGIGNALPWTIDRVTFSPDGMQIAALSQFSLWFWDSQKGTLTKTLEEGHTGAITDLIFNSTQTLLASRSWSQIVVWNLAQGTIAASIDLDKDFYAYTIAFRPKTDTLYWQMIYDVGLQTLDVHTGQKRILLGQSYLSDFAFSPDGSSLAVGTRGEINFYEPDSMKLVSTIPVAKAYIESLVFSRDGKLLAALADDTVRVWKVDTAQSVFSRSIHSGYIDYTLAFDTQQRLWFTDRHTQAVQMIVNVQSGEFRARQGLIPSSTFTQDGSLQAVLNCETASINLIATDASTLVRPLGKARCNREDDLALAFSPDGALLISATGKDLLSAEDDKGDHAIHVWEVSTGKALATFPYPSDSDVIQFSPDGTLLAIGSKNHLVSVWGLTALHK